MSEKNSTDLAKMAKTGGNTKTPVIKRISPGKRWCFTLNNWTEDELAKMAKVISDNNFYYIIGKEVGEQGTPHLQGYIEGEKIFRPSEKFNFTNRIHWEKAKGNRESNTDYCGKEQNFTTNFKLPKPLKILDPKLLFPWQKDIIKIIEEEPDDRSIYWFWEPKGCSGKTTFSKYLAHKYEAIPLEGKKNDILFCAAEFPSDIYIWDLERSMESYVSYGALEKIKNGFFMCSKYESKPIIRNPPHVLVFANFEPDKNALSKDRWKITKINS